MADQVFLYENGRAVGATPPSVARPLWRGQPAVTGRPAWGVGTLLPVASTGATGVKSGRRDEQHDGR